MSTWKVPALGARTLLAAGLVIAPCGLLQAGDERAVLLDGPIEMHFGGGKLGVRLDELQKDDVARLRLSAERGALVKTVEEDSAAAKAGLKEGDVIVGYEGQAVLSAAQLARLVRETPAGRTVSLEVSRDGASRKLSATLGEGGGPFQHLDPRGFEAALPKIAPMMKDRTFRFKSGEGPQLLRKLGIGPVKLGVQYQEVSGQLAHYFKLKGESGVLITSVDEDGPAAKAGMKAGDVVVAFDGKSIEDSGDFQEQVGRAETGQDVTVTVQRDGRPMDLKVQLAGPEKEKRRIRGGVSL